MNRGSNVECTEYGVHVVYPRNKIIVQQLGSRDILQHGHSADVYVMRWVDKIVNKLRASGVTVQGHCLES